MSRFCSVIPPASNHLTPAGHPERPDRLRAIEQRPGRRKVSSRSRASRRHCGRSTSSRSAIRWTTSSAIRDAARQTKASCALDADTGDVAGQLRSGVARRRRRQLAVDEVMAGKARERLRRDASARTPHRDAHARWASASSTTRPSPRATHKSGIEPERGNMSISTCHHGNGSQAYLSGPIRA